MTSRVTCLLLSLSVAAAAALATPLDAAGQNETAPSQQPQVQAPHPPHSTQESTQQRGARSYAARENDIRDIARLESAVVDKLNVKCARRDPSSCAMLKLVTYMNRLLKKANIDIADNIEITQTSQVTETAGDLPRSISEESDESQMASLISAKMMTFLRSRALRLRLLPTTEVVVTSNPDSEGNLNLGFDLKKVSADEGRGKQKHMGGLLAAIVMKFGMLGAMAFKGLVLLVGKALLVSKIALLLAVVLGLKKLFSHHQKHVTYEVVAQPHHSHAHIEHFDHGHSGGGGGGGGHDSYSSGWGRSSDHIRGDAHRLAYRGYTPQE